MLRSLGMTDTRRGSQTRVSHSVICIAVRRSVPVCSPHCDQQCGYTWDCFSVFLFFSLCCCIKAGRGAWRGNEVTDRRGMSPSRSHACDSGPMTRRAPINQARHLHSLSLRPLSSFSIKSERFPAGPRLADLASFKSRHQNLHCPAGPPLLGRAECHRRTPLWISTDADARRRNETVSVSFITQCQNRGPLQRAEGGG